MEDISKLDCEHKKKVENCVRELRTFSNWQHNVLGAERKDEKHHAHISKVSIEVQELLQELCHCVLKDNFNSRKVTGKL